MSIKINRIIVLLSLTFFLSGADFCSAANVPLQDIHCSGTVLDYKADPVAGASVYLFELHYAYAEGRKLWKPLGEILTNTKGKFFLDVRVVDSSNIWVVAYKFGLALGYECVTHASTDIKFIVRLDKPGILAGSVLDENKQPIANAKLRLCLSSGSAQSRDISIPTLEKLFWTATDTQGRFSFTHIPENSTADFLIEAPGKVTIWTFWKNDTFAGRQFNTGREDIEIVLNTESRIEGRVINADTGEGIPGVTLLARANKSLANYYSPYRTVSDQDGCFQIAGLPADDYSIQVAAPYEKMPEWVCKDSKVSVEPGQAVKNIEIPVVKGATIEVTIKNAKTDEPLEGAWVNISQKADFGRHSCYYKSVYSDKNGLVTFRVPPGECRITEGGHSYIFFEEPEPIIVVTGQTYRRNVLLAEKPSVSGIVTDPQGKPVANVLVATKPVCEQSVSTDTQGRFDVRWYLHPRYTSEKWFLLAQDVDNCRAGLIEITEETRVKNITLGPAYTLSGRITDPNDHGIPAASIELRGNMPGWLTDVGNKVTTDKQGRYEIKAVPAQIEDFKYQLEVNTDGYGPVMSPGTRIQGDPNTTVEIPPIILEPADRSISGIVVDANDQPVAGIRIYITGQSQPDRRTITDDEGKFFVNRVCKAPLRIQAGTGGGPISPGFLEAQGGDRNVKVVMGQRSVHFPYQSLKNKPLPDTSDFGIQPYGISNKIVLLCFFDMNQRPSRNCILQLSKKAQELEDKDIFIVAIQASKIEQNQLDEWIKKYEIKFPVGMINEDEEKTRLNRGVKSLPWLILTDTEHVVIAEGFGLDELEDTIQSTK